MNWILKVFGYFFSEPAKRKYISSTQLQKVVREITSLAKLLEHIVLEIDKFINVVVTQNFITVPLQIPFDMAIVENTKNLINNGEIIDIMKDDADVIYLKLFINSVITKDNQDSTNLKIADYVQKINSGGYKIKYDNASVSGGMAEYQYSKNDVKIELIGYLLQHKNHCFNNLGHINSIKIKLENKK